MKRRLECILFDLDSVLYIPSEFLETALIMSVKAMVQSGLRATPEKALKRLKEIRSLDSNAKDHFDRLCLHFNKKRDPLIIAAGIERYWDCKIAVMTSAPETTLTLSTLYQRYPLSIISNGPPLKQAGKIVRLGLSHFFSRHDAALKVQDHLFYATSEKTEMKPYPHLWRRCQKDVGFRFSRALMVGDRHWQDMFGAKRLGMITVKITQGYHSEETVEEAFERGLQSEEARSFFLKHHSRKEILKLMRPDYAISSLGDLEGVVKEAERLQDKMSS